ncbi:MAG: EpsG family protein [Rhodoferax sp.]|nr:EpsG family protein [Rhodoferax sp.]
MYLIVILAVLADGAYRRFVLIFILFSMAMVGGLRYETGYDWLAYEINFDQINTKITLIDSILDSSFEPLYFIFSYIVKSFGGSIQSIFLLSAIFYSFALYKLLVSIRVNLYVPLVLYIGFCYLLAYFIVVRYSLGISFFYIGLIYLFEGRRKFFILMVLVGALFHFFVIFTLPLVLLKRFRLSFLSVIILSSVMIFAGFVIDVGEFFSLLSLIDGDSFFSKFSSYSSGFSENIPFTVGLYILYNILIAIGVSYGAPRNSEVDVVSNVAIWLTIGLIASIIFGYQIPSIWNRVMLAAVPVQGMALALIIDRKSFLFKITIRTIVASIAFSMLIFTLVKENSFFVPYESYFHKLLGISSGVGRLRMEAEF